MNRPWKMKTNEGAAVRVANNGKARLLVASKRTNDVRVGLIIVGPLWSMDKEVIRTEIEN